MSDIFNAQKGYIPNTLKPKAPFKWVLMDIIPATVPIFLTSETTFLIIFLNVDAYSKIPNFMVWKELIQKK